jgi:Na+/H+ antiporter NhaA
VRLITAHRILIGAGIALFVLYAGVELRRYLGTGAMPALVRAVLSGVAAVGFFLYFRTLSRWRR